MAIDVKMDVDTFTACQKCDLEIVARTSEPLRKGDVIEVQFPNSWLMISGPSYTRNVQCSDPQGEHYVNITAAESDAVISMEVVPRHLTYPQGPFRHGRNIIGTVSEGSIPPDTPIHICYRNTFAPYIAHTDAVEIRINGASPDNDVLLKILPLEAETFRIIAPSMVNPGEEFDVLLVSLDQYKNCSSSQYENIQLSTTDGIIVSESLSFEGKYRVRTHLDTPGEYRFTTGFATSNMVCVDENRKKIYWGDIHIHTKLSHDGQGSAPYDYAQNVSGLDFAAVTDHAETLGPKGREILSQWNQKHNDPGRFVTIPGDERKTQQLQGHHNIYFCDEKSYFAYNQDQAHSGINEADCLPEQIHSSNAMLIPHHTGIIFGSAKEVEKGCAIDFSHSEDHGLRPVVEIYSHHGQSECYNPQHILAYEFNRLRTEEKRANTSAKGPYYAQDYWMAGYTLGAIASSDNHDGQGGKPHGGIVAVYSEELDRDAIFEAFQNRHCYATTGERILLNFNVDGLDMGQNGQRKENDKLTIALNVRGTDELLRVEILRYRFSTDVAFIPVLSDYPQPGTMDASYELEDEFLGNCMYYARITQAPLDWPDMAWTSPIWMESTL